MSRASSFCRREVREALHERDGWSCAYCGGTDAPLTLDHLTPTSRGGTHRYTNLVTACHRCNSRKRGRTLAEYLAAGCIDRARYEEVRRMAKRRIDRELKRLRFEAAVEREVQRRLAALAAAAEDQVPF